MTSSFQMLEDFFYILRDEQAKVKQEKPIVYQIRFHQKTIAEFKTTLFNQHYAHKAMSLKINPRDLEVIYRQSILENEFDMEYCIDTV